MTKTGSLLVCLSLVSLTLSGCAGLGTQQRSAMCPDCTDEQWRRINNPTPAERAQSQQIWEQKQRADANRRANMERNKAALVRQKEERLQRCIKERNLVNETDRTFIDLVCKRYVQTGSYH